MIFLREFSIGNYQNRCGKMNLPGDITKKPIIVGSIASLALLSIYFIILTIAASIEYATRQFLDIWYWIVILVLGFGGQVGLFVYIKNAIREKTAKLNAEIAATGGITTGSMIACCAHHVTDVLPIIGLSAAAIFLIRYQIPFIILGIFSNLIGLTIMLNTIQKHSLFNEKSIFKRLFRFDMRIVRNGTIVLSIIVVSTTFIFKWLG
jgi:hypothetical protein